MKAVDEGTKEIVDGVNLAEQAGEALANIQTSVSAVTEQVEQISAAAEVVSASSDEMTRIIEGVSSITEENSAAAEQMEANSEEVSKAIDGYSRDLRAKQRLYRRDGRLGGGSCRIVSVAGSDGRRPSGGR